MIEERRRIRADEPEKAPFIPNVCSLHAAFFLILLAELLAFTLTLADTGIGDFNWQSLGLRSFMLQWVVLLSAALLCPLRYRLAQQPAAVAGLVSFALILLVTGVSSLIGSWLLSLGTQEMLHALLSNLLQAAIIGGVILRYLYVQQQWSNQQKAELQARVQGLQARMHPHFLFNSMNSIASLITTAPEKAERLVEDLCGLLRASLSESSLVSLADELELCRQYLAIEAVRLGERLQVRWHLDPGLQAHIHSIRIPSLLLQPLLENAILHAIQHCPGGGCLDIDLRLQQRRGRDHLLLQVSNPLAPQPQGSRGNQQALANIGHRLQALYGDEAEFLAQPEGRRFIARIGYPVTVTATSASQDRAEHGHSDR